MDNIKELKRVLSDHYVTGSAKLFLHLLYQRLKQDCRANCYSILKGWCESEVDFEKQKRLQIQSISLSSCNNIKTVNLSTLYIAICYAWWIYFFNTQSSFLWVPTVFLFSSISTFSRSRQTSYRGFSRNMKRS